MNTSSEGYNGAIPDTSIFFKLDAAVPVRGDVKIVRPTCFDIA